MVPECQAVIIIIIIIIVIHLKISVQLLQAAPVR